MKLRERLGKEWLFFDGGTGTLLQAQGLAGGEKPETWNLLHPEIIRALHRRYLDAGADILITNTFGANRFHYGEELPGIIRAAVSLARQARKEACREDDAYIALDLGPSGKLLKPLGTLPFEDAVQAFAEIVKTGADAGADLVLIETMNDAFEAKAALLAAKESCDLPVFATCTFDGSGKLLTGGTPSSLIPMLEGLGADAVGINCSLGPEEMLPLVREIVSLTSLPVIVSPNAGLPDVQGDRIVYPVGPKRFALCMKEIASAGAHVLGGCCGTTPEHIRLMKEAVSPLPFQPPVRKSRLIVSSGAAFAEIGGTPLMIGERINPSGKKRFKQALQDHDLDYVLTQALEQEDAGADILDVNTGLPGIDEAAVMEDVITALQSVTVLPLCIDSADPAVLARALRVYNGRPLINSVNGKEESMQAVFPLAKKYGAAVIALCLDESGIPEKAEGRLAVAEKIIRRAEEYGIGRSRLIFDGLTLTISAVPDSALITLETVRALREKLHLKTVLGLSNISFGLPQRSQVNAAFLTMALQAYMAAEDPLELYEYASVNRLTYTKAMEEYSKVFSISSHYSYFYEYLGRLITEDDSVRYRTVEECCEDLAKYAAYMLEDTERRSYDKDSYFTEDKITYMTAVTEKMSLLLQAYFGLTPEEIAKIPETSAARLTIMLEEGYHENHESK